MYLHTLSIKGYKRLVDVEVDFNEATFLIGQNNSGKSSLLKAIEYLLSGKQMPVEDFHSIRNEDGECERAVEEVEMVAEFRDVSQDSHTWRGFAGRTFSYDVEDGSEETGISIVYRKVWAPGKAPVQYLKAFARELKEEYRGLRTIESFIEAGISEELLIEAFDKAEGNITAKN
ncbi:AAA family ATPase, partial [Vibrio parahaemolyticus]